MLIGNMRSKVEALIKKIDELQKMIIQDKTNNKLQTELDKLQAVMKTLVKEIDKKC